MRRFIFVHGPWQLIVATSALKQAAQSLSGRAQDTLVIYSLPDGPLSQSMVDVMRRIATAVWPWHQVIVLNDAIDWWTLRDVRGSIATLRENLGEEAPDELWAINVPQNPTKITAEAYPSARIVLFEDGLMSYLPYHDHRLSISQCLEKPRTALRALKLRLRERLRPQDLSVSAMLSRHRSRISANYLWMSLAVPPSDCQRRLPWAQLKTHFVKDTIACVSPIAPAVDLEPARRPRAILLGQCFSNYDGGITREFELECYADIARSVQRMGYEVLWKEHPRMRRPCGRDLFELVPGVSAFPEIGPWPIEVYVERLGLAACAGLTSTTLFSIPLLFNLPSFSPAGRYASQFEFADHVLARLVGESITQVGSDAA
jgi:hypothetical protein